MWEKFKAYSKMKNYEGVFVWFVSDPKSKSASVTISMMLISFIFVIISLFTKKVDNSNSFSLFVATSSLYLGRKITGKDEMIYSPNEEFRAKEDARKKMKDE